MSKIKRHLMTLFITLGIIVAVLFGVGCRILHSPSFGALPSGERKERILRPTGDKALSLCRRRWRI